MNDLLLSNDDLTAFRVATKRVTNPGARWRDKPGRHKQQNFVAASEDGERYRVYLRQNLDDDRDFFLWSRLDSQRRERRQPCSLQRG